MHSKFWSCIGIFLKASLCFCRNVSKVHDEWFADEEKVRGVVGLLEKPLMDFPNDEEVRNSFINEDICCCSIFCNEPCLLGLDFKRYPLGGTQELFATNISCLGSFVLYNKMLIHHFSRQVTCGICFEDYPCDRIYGAACGHLFCKACWAGFIWPCWPQVQILPRSYFLVSLICFISLISLLQVLWAQPLLMVLDAWCYDVLTHHVRLLLVKIWSINWPLMKTRRNIIDILLDLILKITRR